MVAIVFNKFFRRRYHLTDSFVETGTILNIIDNLLKKHPKIQRIDLENCKVIYKGNTFKLDQFKTVIEDRQELVFSHPIPKRK